MWWYGRLAALAAVAAWCLPEAALAQAFRRSVVPGTQICLFWTERELPWVLNERGAANLGLEEVAGALQRSFDTWQAVECSDLAFHDEGLVRASAVGYRRNGPNENLIVFRQGHCDQVVADGDRCWANNTCANEYGCWGFDRGVIAVTTTSFRTDTGEILDADIEFNEASFRFTTADGKPCERKGQEGCVATDLQNTATHEIGHFFGLDHAPDRNATMYASAPPGETAKRELAEADRAGICHIYPAGEPVTVCDDAYGQRLDDGGGCGCTSGGSGGLAAWGLALAALLGRRRR